MLTIPFHVPDIGLSDNRYLKQLCEENKLDSLGQYTTYCQQWLEKNTQCERALLTHSCTAALEMSAILANLQAGDEVIMPTYTFVSTATAFALRGAVPVFVDIRSDTMNIDENKIEEAITPKTKAIVPVHYAGIACNMERILDIAQAHHLMVIEDAAQCLLASYKGKALGHFGALGTLSFHHTKNITAGQGGALLINDPALVERALIVWQKGTNREAFIQGQVDKYTWVDLGSSFLPSEINAALLWAQFERAEWITQERIKIWNQYHEALEPFEKQGKIKRPTVPEGCSHNGHIYYIQLPSPALREPFMSALKRRGIQTTLHYVPLHQSPAGQQFGRCSGHLENAEYYGACLVRLPLWVGMDSYMDQIIGNLSELIVNFG